VIVQPMCAAAAAVEPSVNVNAAANGSPARGHLVGASR